MADGYEYDAYSLTSARLYEAFPTDGQRANTETGHIEAVTAWTFVNEEASGKPEYTITFAPVTDSDPNSTTDYEKYYVALNFKNTAAASDVQDVEQIFLWRPRGTTGKIRVSALDVYGLDDEVQNLAPSREWTERKISAAIDELTSRLKGRRYDKSRIFNWEELNPAATRLALAYCYYSLAGEGNQFLFEKAAMWQGKADALFEAAMLGYDIAGGGTPDPTETVQTGGAVAFLR